MSLVGLIAVTLAACSTARPQTGAPSSGTLTTVGLTRFPSGEQPHLTAVSGVTLDGTTLRLSDLAGHVVVVNTWASWCYPCRKESPALGQLARQTARLGVRFVGIDEQDRAGAARSFVAAAKVDYPQIVDPDGTILASLRLVPPSAVPSTLVLAKDGGVAARVIGPVDPASLLPLLRELAAEPAPSATP